MNNAGNSLLDYIVNSTDLMNHVITIPNNTSELRITTVSWMRIHEVNLLNEPVLQIERIYPMITENGIKSSYNKISISYFSTSIQRLYKINEGEWKEYTGTIRLETGETIYAKGIDKYGAETRIISSYTATMPGDAIPPVAYDGNLDNNADYGSACTRKMGVDSSAWGKRVQIRAAIGWTNYRTK